MRCVDEGIAPETVDEAALAFGMPVGPIELADTVGLDICLAVGKMLGDGADAPKKLTELIAAGHLGKKTQRGFYDWTCGKAAKGAVGTVPAGLADRLDSPVADRSAGRARRADRDRCGPGRRRRHLRHRLRAVHGRPDALPGGPRFRFLTPSVSIARDTFRISQYRRGARHGTPRGTSWQLSRPASDRSGRNRGKNLAQVVSEGRARRDRPQHLRVGARRIRGKLREVRRPSRVYVHGQVDHLRRTRRAVARVRRLSARQGTEEGRSRRADDAQRPAIPGVPVRHPARRMHGRERQSAVHRARARASAERQRRADHRRRREFRHHRRRGHRQDAGRNK